MHFFLSIFIALFAITNLCGQPAQGNKVTGRLIAPTTSIQADRPFDLGLLLEHEPNWHTYWRFPGDSGIPTSIELDLPAGFSVSEFAWPAPKIYIQAGLVNYVHEKQTLLIFTVTPATDWDPASHLRITGEATWLECDDASCVPGGADLDLTLKVSDSEPEPSRYKDLFASARGKLPDEDPGSLAVTAFRDNDQRFLIVEAAPGTQLPPADTVRFFSTNGHVISRTAETINTYGDNGYLLTFAKDPFSNTMMDSLPGVLVADPGWPTGSPEDPRLQPALAVDPPLVEGMPAMEPGPTLTTLTAKAAHEPATRLSLLPLLGLGFLGGLILNLMPCVFPVLGIKILGFVHQAGAARARVMLHGLVFTTGVLISFWVLTGFLLFLRAGGDQLGWGFQLQSPVFVSALSILLLVFALNLSGVFELGHGLVGAGSQLTQKQGLVGTFFSGVLATVVATPCAAPFLAPALGAGLTLPAVQALMIFTAIGLGLSFPYLLMSAFPRLAHLLPKPGAWMEGFKQLMAFPLYATVGFLVWTYAGLVDDENRLLYLLLGLVCIALASWCYGRYVGTPSNRKTVSRLGVLATCLCGVLGGWLSFYQPQTLTWETWSPARVAELEAAQHPFYIDFTARWCLTCKVNKSVVFSSEDVLKAFHQYDVVLLKADWTQQDPTITQALAEYNRSAVPFNLMYGPGVNEPIALPEVLTPAIVLKHLQTVMGEEG